jgi:glycosyltransferase involved in cell wall biosynthesis
MLPNAIECDRFAFDGNARSLIRAELALPLDAFVFGTVGRMTSEKNQIHAVRVLPALLEKNPESKKHKKAFKKFVMQLLNMNLIQICMDQQFQLKAKKFS